MNHNTFLSLCDSVVATCKCNRAAFVAQCVNRLEKCFPLSKSFAYSQCPRDDAQCIIHDAQSGNAVSNSASMSNSEQSTTENGKLTTDNAHGSRRLINKTFFNSS